MTALPAEALLHGRFVAPPLPVDAVARARVARMLAAVSRVRLVSAPPGYGRTTAMRPAAWVRRQRSAASLASMSAS